MKKMRRPGEGTILKRHLSAAIALAAVVALAPQVRAAAAAPAPNEVLGDWYDIGPNAPGYAQLTPIPLTATAFYYEDARIVALSARLLGRTGDAERYAGLAEAIRAAFNRECFKPEEGR